jgi:hypothetical protein
MSGMISRFAALRSAGLWFALNVYTLSLATNHLIDSLIDSETAITNSKAQWILQTRGSTVQPGRVAMQQVRLPIGSDMSTRDLAWLVDESDSRDENKKTSLLCIHVVWRIVSLVHGSVRRGIGNSQGNGRTRSNIWSMSPFSSCIRDLKVSKAREGDD